jgi:excisionase family DNA binding protein
MNTQERALLTIAEACKVASVSRRTVYNWLLKGKIEHVRTAGGRARIYADSLFKAPEPKVTP